MKKLMIAMAAAAMVGAANAAASYEYEADVTVSNYAAKDSDPSDEHKGWYSCYCLTQDSAQEAMRTWDTVTYETYADWLEQNFEANKQKTIECSQSVSYKECDGSSYLFYSMGSGQESFLTDALCVMFFDNGKDSAYNVTKCDAGYGIFRCDQPSSHFSTGWIAVPEPTSGLLMLLGMAGLALKRRRA